MPEEDEVDEALAQLVERLLRRLGSCRSQLRGEGVARLRSDATARVGAGPQLGRVHAGRRLARSRGRSRARRAGARRGSPTRKARVQLEELAQAQLGRQRPRRRGRSRAGGARPAGISGGAARRRWCSSSRSRSEGSPGSLDALRYSASVFERPSGVSRTSVHGGQHLAVLRRGTRPGRRTSFEVADHLLEPRVEVRLGGPARRAQVGRSRGGAGPLKTTSEPVRQRDARTRRLRELELRRLDLAVRDGVHGRRGAGRVAANELVDALGGQRVAQRVERLVERGQLRVDAPAGRCRARRSRRAGRTRCPRRGAAARAPSRRRPSRRPGPPAPSARRSARAASARGLCASWKSMRDLRFLDALESARARRQGQRLVEELHGEVEVRRATRRGGSRR